MVTYSNQAIPGKWGWTLRVFVLPTFWMLWSASWITHHDIAQDRMMWDHKCHTTLCLYCLIKLATTLAYLVFHFFGNHATYCFLPAITLISRAHNRSKTKLCNLLIYVIVCLEQRLTSSTNTPWTMLCGLGICGGHVRGLVKICLLSRSVIETP